MRDSPSFPFSALILAQPPVSLQGYSTRCSCRRPCLYSSWSSSQPFGNPAGNPVAANFRFTKSGISAILRLFAFDPGWENSGYNSGNSKVYTVEVGHGMTCPAASQQRYCSHFGVLLILDAPVAQWIEQWFPVPCAGVRFPSGVFHPKQPVCFGFFIQSRTNVLRGEEDG